jgi:hypothetical protein
MITNPQLQSPPLCGRLLVVSFVAYAACLTMVAFCVRGCWTASQVLIWGLIAMLIMPHAPHFIWLANPALLVTWILIAKALGDQSYGLKVKAVLASGLALILAASFLLPVGIKDNEGGVAVSIVSRGAGYWLWLASMICAFVSAMLLPVQASAARQAFSNRGTQRDFGDGNRP